MSKKKYNIVDSENRAVSEMKKTIAMMYPDKKVCGYYSRVEIYDIGIGRKQKDKQVLELYFKYSETTNKLTPDTIYLLNTKYLDEAKKLYDKFGFKKILRKD